MVYQELTVQIKLVHNMPCPVQIKDNIVKEINTMSGDYINKSPSFIKILETTINNRFKTPVVIFIKQNDDTYLSNINIPQSLIDEYYKDELIIEGDRAEYEQEQEEKSKSSMFNEYGVTPEEWNNASESEREMIIWQSKNQC
jgi:hypothetical protein